MPKILFDEAHFNVHTTVGSYKPFVALIESDGALVTPLRKKISREDLEPYDILVIANALGAERPDLPRAEKPAFAPSEVDAIRSWVDAGGALLLIADHSPAGAAVADLSSQFGVQMSNRRTWDPTNAGEQYPGGAQNLIFSRKNGLLGDHPITNGRGPEERIHAIITFTGQSLLGPKGSRILLRLGANARSADPARKEGVSAAGRAQGLALQIGRGRLVVLSEAGCLTNRLSPRRGPISLNYPNSDNRQMALNIVRWLAGVL